MPKLIDHEKRRAHIVRAAGELIVASGSHAATVRSVAAQAGLVVGSVRFMFPTQEELLEAVAEDLVIRTQAGVDLRAGHYRKTDMAPSRLAAALPIAADAAFVWRLERGLRLTSPQLAPHLARCRRARASECATVLQAVTFGLDVPRVAMEFEGRRTLALLEGLGEQLCDATPVLTTDQARYLIRTHLEHVQLTHRTAGSHLTLSLIHI